MSRIQREVLSEPGRQQPKGGVRRVAGEIHAHPHTGQPPSPRKAPPTTPTKPKLLSHPAATFSPRKPESGSVRCCAESSSHRLSAKKAPGDMKERELERRDVPEAAPTGQGHNLGVSVTVHHH